MKMLLTCPELGRLAAVNLERDFDGYIADVRACSARGECGFCSKLCCTLLNRRLADLLAEESAA